MFERIMDASRLLSDVSDTLQSRSFSPRRYRGMKLQLNATDVLHVVSPSSGLKVPIFRVIQANALYLPRLTSAPSTYTLISFHSRHYRQIKLSTSKAYRADKLDDSQTGLWPTGVPTRTPVSCSTRIFGTTSIESWCFWSDF